MERERKRTKEDGVGVGLTEGGISNPRQFKIKSMKNHRLIY